MAKNSKNQKIGRRGETAIWKIFEDLGYVCNGIDEDFGEDFFVLGEEDEIIEPFKIFVQVKASEAFDKNPSDWTEYCDPFTVRNWILSNEMTIVVRTNFISNETRFAIPEDECEYWSIDYEKNFPVRLLTQFNQNVAQKLIWVARLRHYDRLIRLTIPNSFESHEYESVPRFRYFLFEFFVRLRIFTESCAFSDDFLDLYKKIYAKNKAELNPIDLEDMTVHEQVRYATCICVISSILQDRSGHELRLTPFFLDQAACALVQFVIDVEEKKLLPVE